MANASIFSQYAAPRSIEDYRGDAQRREANALTLEGVRRKNAMEDMALQQSQAKQNALMQIMQGWTPETTVPQRAASLRTNPEFWGEADKLEAADLDAQKARAGIAKDDAETASKKHQLFKDSLSLIAANPTPEALEVILANLQRKVGDGDAQAGRQLFAGAQTPEQIRERAMRIGLALDKQLPQMQTNDAGGFVSGVAIDPTTGKPIAGAGFTTQKTQSPDNAATQQTALSGQQNQAQIAAAGRAVTMRGQNLQETASQRRDRTTRDTAAAIIGRPLPVAALKLQDEDLGAIGTFAGIDSDLAGIEKQITDGRLELGLTSNLTAQARNYLGASNESSRNLATFKAKLENMRNAVLLLNKGVQTEGDARRAMDEMISNINDKDVVLQRLAEIRALNQRAVQLKKNNIDTVRRNYNAPDMDYSKYENQPAATDLKAPAKVSSDAEYEALPSGATFVGPDGKTRRKP